MQRRKFFFVFLTVILATSLFMFFPQTVKAQTETFGYTSIGGSEYTYWGYGGRDEKVGCLFTLSEAASVTSISMYLRRYSEDGPGVDALKFGVYDDSNNLLGETEVGDIPAYGSLAWVQLDFAVPVALSAGDYWLAAVEDGERCCYYYDAGDTGQTKAIYNGVDFATEMSNPFGTADWTEAYKASIYATYTPSGGPTEVSVTVQDIFGFSDSLTSNKYIEFSDSHSASITSENGFLKSIFTVNTPTVVASDLAGFIKKIFVQSSATSSVTATFNYVSGLVVVSLEVFDSSVVSSSLYILKKIFTSVSDISSVTALFSYSKGIVSVALEVLDSAVVSASMYYSKQITAWSIEVLDTFVPSAIAYFSGVVEAITELTSETVLALCVALIVAFFGVAVALIMYKRKE